MKLQKLLIIIIGMVLLTCGPVYALSSHNPIKIIGNGNSPFSIYDWNAMNGVTGGRGTERDPYIIEGWLIDANGGNHGISISNAAVHFIVRDCEVHSADATGGVGVYFSHVTHGQMNGMYIHDNYDGLVVSSTEDMNLSDFWSNKNSDDGITAAYIQGCTFDDFEAVDNGDNAVQVLNSTGLMSNPNLFTNGYIEGNEDHGFYVMDSCYVDFTNSEIQNGVWNHSYGIVIRDSSYHVTIENVRIEDVPDIGIYVDPSSAYVDIIGSDIIDNGDIGGGTALYLSGDHMTVIDCQIEQNNNYGIALYGDDSEIFHNNFVDNNNGAVQALDHGSDNAWVGSYPGMCTMGNYWSDMSHAWSWYWCGGSIVQFCTNDYAINGTAGSEDTWPAPSAYIL